MGTRSLQNGKVQISIEGTVRNVLTDTQIASIKHGSLNFINDSLDDGVSANEANRMWEELNRSLTSGNEDIDIYDFAGIDIGAGAGLDGLGQALAIEEIVTFFVRNRETSTGNLVLTPSSSNGWSVLGDSHTLPPTGVYMLHCPQTDAFDVADASSHRVNIAASGGAIFYDMIIIGRHDDDESSSSSSSSQSSSSSVSSSSQSSSSSFSSSSSASSSSSSTSSLSSSSTS